MMRNILKVSFVFLLGLVIALPKNTSAITLKEYEDNVAKYIKELQEKESKIAKSKEEVAQVKQNIANIEGQITEAENNIKQLEQEIDESNKKIAKKKEDSKKIMKYFQIVNSGNSYLEYIFESNSVTDMIYRISVVEQLTEYNQKVVEELNQLIKENEQKKSELVSKENELSELKKKLVSEKERIEQDISNVEGTIPSTKGQIKQYQQLVNYYKSKGCKSNDVIGKTCAQPKKVSSGGSSNVTPNTVIGKNGFRFPVNGARITQNYGHAGHRGVDIGKGCGAPIYPVAAGTVFYVGNDLDKSHAYMVMIVHDYNGTKLFSQYAHVQSNIQVRVGDDVDVNDVIAYMGNTGHSFGCHLHLEMSEGCGWGYICGYYSYLDHIINPFKYVPRI